MSARSGDKLVWTIIMPVKLFTKRFLILQAFICLANPYIIKFGFI